MPTGVYVRTPESRAITSAAMNRPEVRMKSSAAHKGHPGAVWSSEARVALSVKKMGHTVSLEVREKLRVFHTGLKASPETRGKNSALLMGNTYALGCHHSEEANANKSEAQKHRSPETQAKMNAGLWKGGRLMTWRRHNAKRRGLESHPLNGWFQGCDGHHLSDGKTVIHIPHWLHSGKGNYHNHNTGRGMERMDALAFNYLFKEEVANALTP